MFGVLQSVEHAHSDSISVSKAADCGIVASSSLDSFVKIWSEESLELKQTLKGHVLGVVSVDVEPSGLLCASSGLDSLVNIWDCQTGQKVRSAALKIGDNWSISFLSDGRYLATGSSYGVVNLIGVVSGKIESSLDTNDKNFIYSATFSADGKFLACGSSNGYIYIFDLASGQLLLKQQAHSDAVRSIKFSSDSKYLISGSQDKYIMIYDVEGMQKIATLTGFKDKVFGVTVSADSQKVAANSIDGSIKVWDLESQNCLQTFNETVSDISNNCWAISFNRESKIIAAFEDGSLKTLNVLKESALKHL
ncbi:MAG: WD repeat-containing protein 61 [Paramarteilia canceri]